MRLQAITNPIARVMFKSTEAVEKTPVQAIQKIGEGLNQPASVVAAIRSYQHESDKLAQFADERLVADITSEVKNSPVLIFFMT